MQSAEKLSIILPAEMVRIIRAKVDGGTYGSNSDVVREAMQGWIERERRLAELDGALERGLADAEAGRVKTTDEVRRGLLTRLGIGVEAAGA